MGGGCDLTIVNNERPRCARRQPSPTPTRAITSRRKRKPTRSLGSGGRGRLTLIKALCIATVTQRYATVAFPESLPHGPCSRPGSSGLMTLRVRMPDGAVKRVTTAASDTVEGVMGNLGMGGVGEGLSTDGTEPVAERTTSLASLGLKNGDFLYVKSDAAARAAAKSKAVSLGRIKAVAADGAGARERKFVPFPDQARPPPPRVTKRVKTWRDVEAMQAQVFSLKPQKESNVRKISVEKRAMEDFVGFLKETGFRNHRCALLFGRINAATKAIKVEAMFEPPQGAADSSIDGDRDNSGSYFDSSALLEAAAAAAASAVATVECAASSNGGGDGAGKSGEEPLSEVAAEVIRAVRVAELLGLRLVGCCLSHGKREHFMAARDVITAAAVQLMSMADKGRDEGVLVATVTVPVNATDGEVATEAFSVSNQTVQMFSEGLLAEKQPEPASDRVTTTAVVREDGTETRTPETLGLICNVAIVQHEGVLRTRFPAANRAKPPSLSDLKACLFSPVKAGRGSSGKQKQPSFLKRLSDFQLLIFLSRQMGFSRDFEGLCAVVKNRDSKSAALGSMKVVLENLCEGRRGIKE